MTGYDYATANQRMQDAADIDAYLGETMTELRWFAKWSVADEARRLVESDPWARDVSLTRNADGYWLTWRYTN